MTRSFNFSQKRSISPKIKNDSIYQFFRTFVVLCEAGALKFEEELRLENNSMIVVLISIFAGSCTEIICSVLASGRASALIWGCD